MKWPFWTRTGLGQPDDCESIDPLLSLYADGMTSSDESRRVEAHLLGCADCRESLQWMQATQRALSRRPVVAPPADLHARIAAAIAASSASPLPAAFQTRPARAFALRPALAAAASVSILGIVGYGLLHHPSAPVAVRPVNPVVVATAPKILPVPIAKSPTKPLVPLTVHAAPAENTRLADRNTDRTVEEDTSTPPEAVKTGSSGNAVKPAPMPVRSHAVLVKKPTKVVLDNHLMAKTLVSPTAGDTTPIVKPEDKKPDTVVAVIPKPDTAVPVTVAPTVIHQDPAPTMVASSGTESHLHNADFLDSVKAHLGEMQHFVHSTGGSPIKGAVYASHTLDPDKTAYVPGIYSP